MDHYPWSPSDKDTKGAIRFVLILLGALVFMALLCKLAEPTPVLSQEDQRLIRERADEYWACRQEGHTSRFCWGEDY